VGLCQGKLKKGEHKEKIPREGGVEIRGSTMGEEGFRGVNVKGPGRESRSR